MGAAAAALLVRDWSVLTTGGTLIRTRWRRWGAGALSVVGLAMLAALAHYATGSAREFRAGLLIVVAVAAVLVVAPVALDQGGPVARVLAWRPLVWLGAISYGVYLWHWPIFLALNGERTGWSGWPLFALRCAATVAVAAASWWLLEQPIRRWRPVIVPMLPLAGATAATAAAVTMLVLPVGVKPADAPVGPDVDSAALVSPEVPVEVRSPSGQLHPRDQAGCGVRRLGRVDVDALPAADARTELHQLHDDRVRGGPRRALPVRRPDAEPETRMRRMAESVVAADQP